MEALKEITIIGLVLTVAILLGNIIVNLYWRWHSRKNEKISEDYKKAVEKHKLLEAKEYAMTIRYPDPPKRKEYVVPSQLVDHNFNLWNSDFTPDPDMSPSNHSYYDWAGHGGSFGGGGASGSWGSDDSSSSSYSDSSSDSGGSDSSSSD